MPPLATTGDCFGDEISSSPKQVEVNAEEFLQAWQVAKPGGFRKGQVGQEGFAVQDMFWQVVSGYLDAAHRPQLHPSLMDA